MSTPKILDRITKLLQLAGPKNPHEQEARSAAHQAVKLILEHQIVLALPRETARDGARAAAPHAPPWSRPYDGGPPFTEPPPFTDEPPPPPFDPFAPFHPFANAQPYDAQAYADYINRTMYQRAAEAARRQAERAQREAEARRRQPQADDPFSFDDVFGFGRENQRARSRAWRAAGRPMKKAFDPNTGDEINVPNYDGLDF